MESSHVTLDPNNVLACLLMFQSWVSLRLLYGMMSPRLKNKLIREKEVLSPFRALRVFEAFESVSKHVQKSSRNRLYGAAILFAFRGRGKQRPCICARLMGQALKRIELGGVRWSSQQSMCLALYTVCMFDDSVI